MKLIDISKTLSKIFRVPVVFAGRFGYSWALMALWFAGQVVGWTLIVSESLRLYSLSALLPLLLLDSALMLAGGVLSVFLLPKFSRKNFLLFFWSCALGLVILAGVLNIPFYALLCLLIAKSVFWQQSLTQIHRETEHLFSPNEARRLLARIETAHIIGGLFGGVLFLILIGFAPPMAATWLWAGIMVAGLILFTKKSEIVAYVPEVFRNTKNTKKESNERAKHYKNPITEIISLYRGFPVIGGISLVVILGVGVLSGVEFLFLEHLYHEAADHGQKSIPILHASAFSFDNLAHQASVLTQKFTTATDDYFAHHNLAHGLSIVHIAGALLALGLQSFWGSKVLAKFGVIRTLYAGLFFLHDFPLLYRTMNPLGGVVPLCQCIKLF